MRILKWSLLYLFCTLPPISKRRLAVKTCSTFLILSGEALGLMYGLYMSFANRVPAATRSESALDIVADTSAANSSPRRGAGKTQVARPGRTYLVPYSAT